MDDARDRAMRAMVEGTAELVALVNGAGIVEYVSPSVTPMLGWDPSDVVGQSVLALIHPEDLAAAFGAITENIATPADGLLDREDFATTDEYRLKHRDGRWVSVEAIGNNLLLTEGINGMLVVGREVTRRHRLDQALTALATKPIDVHGVAEILGLVDELLRGTSAARRRGVDRAGGVTGTAPADRCRAVGAGDPVG
jgi:PAS domain S-box-containing protein